MNKDFMPPALLTFPQFDPFIFRLNLSFAKIGLSWYAFMYLVGFVIGYFVIRYRYRSGALRLPNAEGVSLLVTYCFYGLILGARIFYIIFYNPVFYFHHAWEIPAIWHGGMSFHGGLLGTIFAMWMFSRRMKIPMFMVSDTIGLCAPIGLFFGRIGNFINGELWGRVAEVPWAMVFPSGGPLPRHPSQLYEALLEGLVLSLVLWSLNWMKARPGVISAMLLIGYGALRFIVEFFREPDAQLGFLFLHLTMGQLLCATMVVMGFVVLAFAYRWPKSFFPKPPPSDAR